LCAAAGRAASTALLLACGAAPGEIAPMLAGRSAMQSAITRSLVRPHESAGSATPWRFWASQDLPPEVVQDSLRRMRVLALLFAATFFMAAFFPSIVSAPARSILFAPGESRWLPGVIAIAFGVAVYVVTGVRGIPAPTLVSIALIFEVGGSYGIAFAEYQGFATGITTADGTLAGFGLSWVGVWVPLFTVVVPTPPLRAVVAAALAVTAVPVAAATAIATGSMTVAMTGEEFFFWLVFPYALIVVVAFVGSRVVYRLGRAVREAQELGSYRLVELLGEGGMGEVWRAEHRMLARPAAIKLVRPEMLGGAGEEGRRLALSRFEREAQATAAMRSPHTVELYDFGVTDDGSFYYVMELLDGLDLERLVLDFGPQPVARVVHILGQVCQSLAEAHEHGLIHRDIKPANIYVCRLGRDLDWVKVLDFGLVKASGRDGRPSLDVTAGDVIRGTPAFMAPEQVTGEWPVDGRTDLYAVGCVGYWLLTGHLVFEGRTPVDTMMLHVEAPPVPPSRRVGVAVPEALEATLLRCLAKDPADRPPTAEALAAMLRDVSLAEPWDDDRARAWWDAHRPAARSPASSTVPVAS
jgi:serine/threonine-protein kinase